MSVCAFCYGGGSDVKLMTCAGCKKRKLCSRECQVGDWRKGHKVWCGKSGERDVDWVVKESAGKGRGVFALRQFAKGDKIMIERPVPFQKGTTKGMRDAIDDLLPSSGSLKQKMQRNDMSLGEDSSRRGLFLGMSMVNHNCVANSSHFYIKELDVKMLVATRTIEQGDEIEISYHTSLCHEDRVARLQKAYGIVCTCQACSNGDLSDKLDMCLELDKSILLHGRMCMTDTALMEGKKLIRLYDELDKGDHMYCRTYYDLFQMAIRKRSRHRLGVQYATLAAEHAIRYYGENTPEVIMYEELAADPRSHHNYGIEG